MLHFLDTLPLWALGIAMVGSCVLFAFTAAAIGQRNGWTLAPDDIDSATVLHALVGLVYAVALGLIAVNVEEDHTDVKQAAIIEASAIGDLYRDMEGLDASVREPLRAQVRTYVRLVIDEEWPSLHKGVPSAATERELRELSSRLITMRSEVQHELVVQRALLEELSKATDARRKRIFMGMSGISVATWMVVILGAMITLGFAGLFPMRRHHQRFGVGLAASMLGLMLFLIVATDRPLRGQMAVGPESFEELRQMMEQMQGDSR